MKTETQWTDRGPWAFYYWSHYEILYLEILGFRNAQKGGALKKSGVHLEKKGGRSHPTLLGSQK